MTNFTNFYASTAKASYLALLVVAKDGKPHTIGETLVINGARAMTGVVVRIKKKLFPM